MKLCWRPREADVLVLAPLVQQAVSFTDRNVKSLEWFINNKMLILGFSYTLRLGLKLYFSLLVFQVLPLEMVNFYHVLSVFNPKSVTGKINEQLLQVFSILQKLAS